MANNGLVIFKISNAEIAQHRRTFKAGTLIHGHHLRAVFLLRQFAGIGHHDGRSRVTFWLQLRQEDIMEALAVDVFNKQHGAAVAGLLKLALGQRRHTGVGFRLRQHFILMARRPGAGPHHVDRRHRAGKQREDHRRFHQHGLTQAAGMHHRDFTFGIQFAQRHQQPEE